MPNYLSQPAIQRLPDLIRELRTGDLRIPPFQRDFVWQGEQRLQLFDSVLQGLPTGGLMLWRTKVQLKTDPILGPMKLNRPEPEPVRQYLLDGRQRLTTLFAALAPALWTLDETPLPDGWEPSAPDGTPWDIFYDLDSQAFFLDDEDSEGRLPMRVLFDDFGFDEWLREHGGTERKRWNIARHVKSAFTNYQMPTMPIYTDDLQVVTLTFKRVNDAGTPMGTLAMARALSWTEDFDLEERIEEMKETLRPSPWTALTNDTLLKVIACSLGFEPTGIDLERLSGEVRATPNNLENAAQLLTEATKVLDRIGVKGPASLPYERALVALVRALHHGRPQPSPEKMNTLAAWAAETCVTEAFGSAPPHVLRAMHLELLHRLDAGRRPNSLRQAQRCKKFSMAWARSRVTAVAMGWFQEVEGEGRILQDLGHEGTALTPQLLAREGVGLSAEFREKLRRQPPNAHLMRSPGNRLVGTPATLRRVRTLLCQAQIEDHESEVLRTHGISPEALTLWRSGQFNRFLQMRQNRIHAIEIEWLHAQRGEIRWKTEVELIDS